MEGVDIAELDLAEMELGSLLRQCKAVVRGCALSPSRQTLMTNRVAALGTALELGTPAESRHAT
jgi:hypothetical protein